MVHADHPAVEHARHGLQRVLGGPGNHREQLLRALRRIGVGVLLECDDGIGVGDQPGRHVTVQVQFDANRHARTDDVTHALDQVALAVVIPLRDYGAM